MMKIEEKKYKRIFIIFLYLGRDNQDMTHGHGHVLIRKLVQDYSYFGHDSDFYYG